MEDLARSVLQQPLRVTVGLKNAAVPNVRQRLQFVGREAGKLLALRQLLADGGLAPPVLVFVGSKERAKALHRQGQRGGSVLAMKRSSAVLRSLS